METATRVGAPSIGESQDLNSTSDPIAAESGDQVNTKVNYSTEEFLRHETNLINDSEYLKPIHQNSKPQTPLETVEKVSNESTSDLIENDNPSFESVDKLEVSSDNIKNEESSKQDEDVKLISSRGPEANIDNLPEHEKLPGESETLDPSCPINHNENDQLKQHEGEKHEPESKFNEKAGGDLPNTPERFDASVAEGVESISNGKVLDNDHSLTDEAQSRSESTEFKENEDAAEGTTQEEWMDILGSGHLMKKVIIAGIPNTRPNKADICLISYTGHLEDGTVVDKAENVKIHLNDNEVIQGIDFALALMDKGEEAEVKVGPRFAYGSLGRKPDIPAGATLFYNVKLLDVNEEAPIHSLKVDERISVGLQKKERGNWWYSRGEHTIAINCYRRALEYLDDTDIPEPHSEEDIGRLLEERLKTYNNLGASQMKINAFDAALMSVNNVLTAQPKNVKALFRKAKILKEKGELNDSISIVRQALTHDPDNQALQQELSSLLAAQRKANSKQRELYKKMMGTGANQDKENEKKNSSKNNYTALKWVTLISFAVAVIGSIAIKYKA